MKNIEKFLENADKLIGSKTIININKNNFPLLIKIFNHYRDEITISTPEYENLKRNKKDILINLENSFSNEQKILFEKYWEIENEIQSIIEEEIFLFGYLIKKELDIET